MAYRFKLHQSIEKGVRRIGVEQIDAALARLGGKPEDVVIAVHETRKCMKRIRALLRLVRPSLAVGVFKRENARFRDIAALLSSARDRHVLNETLVKLAAAAPASDARLAAAIKEARASLGNGEVEVAVPATDVRRAINELEGARVVFAELDVAGSGFAVLEGGLRRTYGNARTVLAEAYRTQSDEAFHELRKSVQQHWRHMLLVSRCWPEACAVRACAARDLSQILGDDHDLAMLMQFIAPLPARALKTVDKRRIDAAARARQKELRGRARYLAELLLAEEPREFCRRVGAYWKMAKANSRTDRHGTGPGASSDDDAVAAQSTAVHDARPARQPRGRR